ncbi:hypothetical protein [Lichenibacterium dinghuense]|uniref:hypothetical protein n=1 Tax=Lichenibacterium dinghuense TaxID=2895977 RepID=UPI001F33841E|nr:hypothetical protein [Lichenibacterium sp. 6Y81]
MSERTSTTDDPASEPAEAEVEHRAMELAKADGLTWAAPGTPEHGAEGQPGAATNDDRDRYRRLARERLESERGLIVG